MEPITDALASIQTGRVIAAQSYHGSAWEVVFTEEREAAFVYLLEGNADVDPSPDAPAERCGPGAFLLLAPHQSMTLRHTEAASFLHGRIALETPWHLPRLIHICTQHAVPELKPLLTLLAAETYGREPAANLLMNRLAHLALLYALRDYAANARAGEWPRALSDPRIGSSIRCMQEAIEHPWTVAGLAARAGMSRAVFAQRFKDITGNSPGEFLTQQRMYRATQLLRENRKLSDVAQLIGYASDGAFHRAFRRVIGVSPGVYRRGLN